MRPALCEQGTLRPVLCADPQNPQQPRRPLRPVTCNEVVGLAEVVLDYRQPVLVEQFRGRNTCLPQPTGRLQTLMDFDELLLRQPVALDWRINKINHAVLVASRINYVFSSRPRFLQGTNGPGDPGWDNMLAARRQVFTFELPGGRTYTHVYGPGGTPGSIPVQLFEVARDEHYSLTYSIQAFSWPWWAYQLDAEQVYSGVTLVRERCCNWNGSIGPVRTFLPTPIALPFIWLTDRVFEPDWGGPAAWDQWIQACDDWIDLAGGHFGATFRADFYCTRAELPLIGTEDVLHDYTVAVHAAGLTTQQFINAGGYLDDQDEYTVVRVEDEFPFSPPGTLPEPGLHVIVPTSELSQGTDDPSCANHAPDSQTSAVDWMMRLRTLRWLDV